MENINFRKMKDILNEPMENSAEICCPLHGLYRMMALFGEKMEEKAYFCYEY